MADTQQNILINIDLETGQVNTELDNLDSKIKNLGEGAKIETFKSVRTQIREAREEAVRLAIAIEEAEAAGENVDNLNKRYEETTKKAASLNDAVDKTNKSIANSNPDNRLQGLISITQGAVVAVQGLAGAFTILGVDSETANESIARLQGLIALTGAISSIDDVIDAYKDLKRNIDLAAISTKVSNAATAAATVIQRAFTGSVVATGTAFKVLRAAIVATGLGALAIALTFVIGKIIDFVSATDDASAATQRFNDKLKDLSDKRLKDIDNATKIRIAKLKAEGASELEIEQATLDGLKQKRTQYEADIKQKDAEYRATRDNAKKEEYKKELDDYISSRDNLVAEIEITEFNIKRIKREGTESTNKEQQELRDKNSEKVKDETEKDLKELSDLQTNLRAEEKRRRQTDFENEVDDIKKKYERAIALAKAYGRNSVELEVSLSAELIAARQRRDQEGRRFFLEESLSIVENQAKDIARRVEALAAGGAIVPEEVKKQFSAEIKEVFASGAALRVELADQVRRDRIAQAEKLLKDNKPLLEALKKGIESDFKVATQQIKDEINNSEQSLNKGIQLIIDQATQLQVENRIKTLENLLDEVTKPLRKEIVGESGLQRFFRKTFTTITLVGEDILNAQEKLDLEILKQADKTSTELFNLEENGAKKQLEREKISAALKRDIAFGDAELELNNAKLRGENLLDAQIKFFKKRSEIDKQYKAEIEKLDEDFETESQNRFQNATEKRIKNEQARTDLQNKARRRAERGLFSTESGEQSFTRNFLSGARGVEAFDKALKATEDYYGALTEQENTRYATELANAKFQGAELEKVELQHKENLKFINQNFANDIDTINRAQLQSKLELYEAAGNAIGNLGALFEQGTAASKIAGLASMAIDTAVGFTRGLAIAQEASKGTGPAAAYAFPIFYAQQVAAVLAAANRARQIINQVKGGATSGGPTPVAPSINPINASIFNLPPQAQDVRVTNQASQVVRAYITNEDLRTAQERQQFLNKLSSF